MRLRPKGSYVRTTPDWFSSQLCMGGWYQFQPGTSFQYTAVGLYNEGQSGDLYVYSISYTFPASDLVGVVVQQGPRGTRKSDCFPVDPRGVTPAAGIYYDIFGAAQPPQVVIPPQPGNRVVLGSNGFTMNMFPTHPLFILPPGWGVFLVDDNQDSITGAGFWFTVL